MAPPAAEMGGVEGGGVGKGKAASRGAVAVALDDVEVVPLAAACGSLVRRSSGHLLVPLVLRLPSVAPSRVGGGVFQQKQPPLTSRAP